MSAALDRPVVWTLAASDSGGGAGIQADLKTLHQLGVHACTVITAITSQNSCRISEIFPLPSSLLRSQLQILFEDMPASVLKLGMLGNLEIITELSSFLKNFSGEVVCDPVLKATTGRSFLDEEGKKLFLEQLLPQVDVLTPNLSEAEHLLNIKINSSAEIENAAQQLKTLGAKTVVIKGGHGSGKLSQDYVCGADFQFWLSNDRLEHAHTHGTGCTFASAFAASLTFGYTHSDAAVIAKMFTTQGIRNGYAAGKGEGCVWQGNWPESQEDLPCLTANAEDAFQQPNFPECTSKTLGLYPVVDSAQWVQHLLKAGVRTLQLRNKDLHGEALETEIQTAIRYARDYDAQLFINDYWELAIKHGAYGVHLGQEDLDCADFYAIANAGIRLGVSTHCYYEVARAHALRPSYIACGPIYETPIKVMKFAPQGLDALERWVRTLDYPLVAIGGIDEERACIVKKTEVGSIALIRAITHAPDFEAATQRLLKIVEG